MRQLRLDPAIEAAAISDIKLPFYIARRKTSFDVYWCRVSEEKICGSLLYVR